MFFEHVVDEEAEVGRLEMLVLAHDVAARQNRLNDRRIGARTADVLFLKCLDERRLVVSRRRFREVLLGQEIQEGKRFPCRKFGQEHVLFLLVVGIDGEEARELQRRAGSARDVALACRHADAHRIEDGGRHLARDEALPDQGVEAKLLTRQIFFHKLGRVLDTRRPNRLVRVLRLLARRIDIGLFGQVIRAERRADVAAYLIEREVGKARRIRAHVGDEADGAAPAKFDAFIELLGDHHRAARREAELPRCVLLHAARRKGRDRIAPALALLDLLNRKDLLRHILDES